jgi:hypothetical protein
MGLNKFPDTLLLVIFHFGSNIGNGSLCVDVPLISHRCQSPPSLLFDYRLSLHSCQGLVTVREIKLHICINKEQKQVSDLNISPDSKTLVGFFRWIQLRPKNPATVPLTSRTVRKVNAPKWHEWFASRSTQKNWRMKRFGFERSITQLRGVFLAERICFYHRWPPTAH